MAHVPERKKVFWRCDPESNWANRICNPGHNRFAIAPQEEPSDKKGKTLHE